MAGESAAAEARAAGAALVAVEAGIALYAERRDYLKLKDIAEASDVAGKVCPTLEVSYSMRSIWPTEFHRHSEMIIRHRTQPRQ